LKCTWAQLGLQTTAILNTNGFYDALIVLLNNGRTFLKAVNKDMLLVSSDIEDLIYQMKNYVVLL
jgi:predicted Rossmann-fold nucleotide-binding protein